jgi:competence protein ComEA
MVKETTMIGHKKININEASREELEEIPGIDENAAEAIIRFREKRGWINNLEELRDLEVIPPQEMGELHEWLTLASERTGSLEYEGKEEDPDAL